ncbi:MAG: DUF502 domain-containing protein [Halobacteriaceae archaeon]
MSTWKRDAASGLAILAPIAVTLYVVYWLYRRIASLPLFTAVIPDPAVRVAVTIAVFVLLVFAVGYLMRTALGSLVERGIDSAANRLPGLRVVYNASKMAVETAVAGTDELQAPVKLEPWNGMRMTAFKTGKVTADGREVLFMPTAPNITTGFVIEVEPEDFEETDERVEEALTRILSAGFGEQGDVGAPAGTEIDVEDIDQR